MRSLIRLAQEHPIWPLALLVLILAAASLAHSGEPTRVSNVRFEMADSNIVIHYDLSGSADGLYRITALLRKENDRSFRYTPKNLRGDVGEGKFAGANRTIVWNVTTEFPLGLKGSDFYFEIGAESASGSSSTALWYGLGAAALGGVAFVLFRSSPEASPAGQTGFPAPPGRPQ